MTSYPEQQVRENLVSTAAILWLSLLIFSSALIRKYQPDTVMTWRGEPDYSLLPSAGWSDLGYFQPPLHNIYRGPPSPPP
jgi:hypothetical protein